MCASSQGSSSQLQLTSTTSSYESTQEQKESTQKPARRKFSIREYEGKVGLLENIILTGFMVFILIGGMMYLTLLRKNHTTVTEMKAQLSELKEKHKTEVETLQSDKEKVMYGVKNNELTASVKMLITRNEILEQLKEKKRTSKEIRITDVSKILDKTFEQSCANWSEIESKFETVNPGFYDRLNKQHTNLTSGDLKITALLKLNCSTKDMARLLNISVESVHTTRYRLRKKLGLSRNDDLIEYIDKI